MLPRSRVVCVFLLGLSARLIVLGVLLPRYLHADNRLPLSLGYTTLVLRDDDATVGSGDNEYRGAVTKQFHAELMDPVDEREVTLRIGATMNKAQDKAPNNAQETNGQETQASQEATDLDRLITAKVWNYRMDRMTGEALGDAILSDQLVGPTQTVPMSGLWAKFPMDAQRQEYEVFDDTLRQSRPARFVGEDKREGRSILQYRQEIEPTNVATLFADAANTTMFAEPDGGTTSGYLFHSATRDWFVDEATGLIVEVRESVDDFYGTKDGQKRQQVLLFDGVTTPESSSQLLSQAAAVPDGGWLTTLRWSLIGVGGVLAFVGLLGVFGVGDRRGARKGR